MADDELLDLLLELQHDLGKYLRLPLSMLPPGADDGALREALERALRSTRKGPSGVRTAREIWRGFRAELGERLHGSPALGALEAVVERALARESVLDGGRDSLDRAEVTAELSAVGEAIRALIDEQEVHGG